jgi:hypothetical protein
MPLLLHRPTVGLMPTKPLTEAGKTMEPSVYVPMLRAQRLADVEVADPELEPDGLRLSI